MKKMMAMIMTIAMAASMTACGSTDETSSTSNTSAGTASIVSQKSKDAESAAESSTEYETMEIQFDGAWTVNDGDLSIEKNADAKAAFEKAAADMLEVDYEPIAVLGSQVVAGTNYCILCKLTAVVPDAEPRIELVYIYEDLDGNAEITDYKEIIGEPVDGSFIANDGDMALEKNESIQNAYDRAMEGMVGAAYEPIAYLGSQVVAGTNYLVLCRSTVASSDAEPAFTLVTVYEDLDGSAELLDIDDLVIGGTDTSDNFEQIPNPWSEYNSISEASAAAGVDFSAPDVLDDYSISLIQAMDGIVEVNYGDEPSEISIRKGKGLDDISGDYNTYAEVSDVSISDMTVTLKGNDGKVYCAVWNDGADSYSYNTESGFSSETVQTHIAVIIEENAK